MFNPAVPDVYDRQFFIPQKCILDSLGQEFLVHDNGQPNHIVLLEQTKVFDLLAIHRTGFWIEHLNQAKFNLCNCKLSID